MRKVLTLFGTRPEAIKMAPIVTEMAHHRQLTCRVCVTAQHREMLDQVLALFDIRPEYDLGIMRPGQNLFDLTSRALAGLREVLTAERPDLVLVQGDTTTAFAGALAAFYCRIPVGHVEAGLRTGDLAAPFPEEGNRSLIGRLARLHFAPTDEARRNLERENVDGRSIHVTGNTVIDALLAVRDRVARRRDWGETFGRAAAVLATAAPLVLITAHRRENFGAGMEAIFGAIAEVARRHPDWAFVFPVHRNPNVRRPVGRWLDGLDNVYLLDPLDYAPFVYLMDRSRIILTDSGGIQEEAPSLGTPVLVMRDRTERPEGVAAGTVKLVGTDRTKIVAELTRLMTDEEAWRRMATAHNPYGDGKAAQRIVRHVANFLDLSLEAPRPC